VGLGGGAIDEVSRVVVESVYLVAVVGEGEVLERILDKEVSTEVGFNELLSRESEPSEHGGLSGSTTSFPRILHILREASYHVQFIHFFAIVTTLHY